MSHQLFSSLPAPSTALQACVIIPARDESEGIAAALDCFAGQLDANGRPLAANRFEVVLLANNCSDGTAAVARAWGAAHPAIALHVVEKELHGDEACVGYVRRLLMDAAAQRLLAANPSAPQAICSTDADTHVSPFWIAHTLAEMAAGAQAVGGRIFLKRDAESSSRRTYLLDTAYRLLAARLEGLLDPRPGDPAPRHFQFFGASLAISPELYQQVGGLPHVRCLEDMALERELARIDQDVRHSPHVTVSTSARRAGRVETGLSTQLNEWNDLGSEARPWLVPSALEIEFKARLRRRLRSFWSNGGDNEEAATMAAQLMMSPPDLVRRLDDAGFFGAVWEQLWFEAWEKAEFRELFPPVPVELALADLRLMLQGIREK